MIFNNDKAIYVQMADRLCDEILSGKYNADDRIPSVREYAVMLEVNTNTAVKAYDLLAREDRTLIISTHQVHDVESLLDHILILDNSKLLLNESIANITENYSFTFRQPSEMDESVIYSEPSLQGNAVIAKRQEDENETQLNLELLFNAVTKGLIK